MIANVSAGSIIDPDWGNDVANTLNGSAHAGGGWTSFTPSWANLTVGNGTTDYAVYRYVPEGIRVRAHLTWGSTTSASGSVSMTIPNSETSAAAAGDSLGVLAAKDGSADQTGHVFTPESSTSIFLYCGGNDVTATNPFTWTTGDQMFFDIVITL